MPQFYPLLFEPIFKPVLWGGDKIVGLKGLPPVGEQIGESWELADLNGNFSVVANGPWKGCTLRSLMEQYPVQLVGTLQAQRSGGLFPLLVKLIDASRPLSIQVHPTDEMAEQENASVRGKSEMWYIMQADSGAQICLGLTRPLTEQQYAAIVGREAIMDELQYISVQAGQVFHIPAGTVHAIGKGCLIAEIQQSSDTTYRLFDYNRKDKDGQLRTLHCQEALRATRLNSSPLQAISYSLEPHKPILLIRDKHFSVFLLNIEAEYLLEPDRINPNGCLVLQSVRGAALLNGEDTLDTKIAYGSVALIPAACSQCTWKIVPGAAEGCTLLLTIPEPSC